LQGDRRLSRLFRFRNLRTGSLTVAKDSSAIVRRYRAGAAPLVRDLKASWRGGRLEAVLAGDFDLIGTLAR